MRLEGFIYKFLHNYCLDMIPSSFYKFYFLAQNDLTEKYDAQWLMISKVWFVGSP